MSKIVKFKDKLAEIWPKLKKVYFPKKFEIVKTLQQNASNRGGDGDGYGNGGGCDGGGGGDDKGSGW